MTVHIEEDQKLFHLMHGNHEAAQVEIDLLDGSMRKVRITEEALLPPGGNLSTEDLRKWWIRRAVPQIRGNIQKVLEAFEITNTNSLLVKNLGLSLSDHYWLKPDGSDLDWTNINPYENSFRDTVGEMQLNPSAHLFNVKASFMPGASLQGELKKKWIIGKDKERYLVKGNYGFSYQQSINEVIATKIHEGQNRFPYVKYQLAEVELDAEKALGCMCKNFADTRVEFIPAYDVVSSVKKRNDISEYESFINVCETHGLSRNYVRQFLEYQILTDFLITNVDRHFNNFGVLRDAITLRYVDVAPIFDSGNSMLWNRRNIPESAQVKNFSCSMEATSFKKTEAELLKYVTDFQLVNLTKLPLDVAIMGLLKKEPMNQERLPLLMDWYHAKANILEQLQLGKSLIEIMGRRFV